MEEEIAFLVESMRGLGYREVYEMPYSRRKRLVVFKEERIREQIKAQKEAASRSRRK